MSRDIQEFIIAGSQKITPAEIARFEAELPLVLAKVNDLDAPGLPNLCEQTQFLVRFVEDCLGSQYKPEDVSALAEALFALMYFLKGVDIIPDDLPGGYADDSAVIRDVLSRHTGEFKRYAGSCGSDFSRLPLDG